MIVEELLPLLGMVRAARTEVVDDGVEAADRCAELLRLAEDYASELPLRVVDDAGALQAVTAVRTELGTCLIAADRLTDAGVNGALIVAVLRRGTALAEQALTLAVFGAAPVGATS